MISSKKKLAMILSRLKDFEKPKALLEQYMTPSELAADLLWTAFMSGDIEGKEVVDLGSGTGILAIGASLLGAKNVTCYEVDADAIEIARKNIILISELGHELGKMKFVRKDILDLEVKERADCVIMNPPFGVQLEHADRLFLQKAMLISDKIYSIHKSESSKFLQSFSRDNGYSSALFDEKEMLIRKTMEHHKKELYAVKVGFWRFVKSD